MGAQGGWPGMQEQERAARAAGQQRGSSALVNGEVHVVEHPSRKRGAVLVGAVLEELLEVASVVVPEDLGLKC